MANRLPGKLTELRNHFGYAKGDIANKIGVSVTSYMKWENGNEICDIQTLKKIADLYQVSLRELADNTKEVTLPELPELTDSVEIPFMNHDNADPTDEIEVTADLGSTKVMNKDEFEPTVANVIVDDLPEDQTEEHQIKIVKRNSARYGIIAGIVGVIAIAILLIMMMRGHKDIVSLSQSNRLALGDTYSIYIDKNSQVQIRGTFDGSDEFKDVIQVSAFDGHAVGLKKNGTVVTNDGNQTVASWNKVVYIAAGKDHSVGVTQDGKVLCSGNNNACQVSDWTDVKYVYAGNGITLGIQKDGTLLTSGVSGINATGIKSAAVSDNEIVLIKNDGTALSMAINGGSTLQTSEWTNVEEVAAGHHIAAAVTANGKVVASIDDEEFYNHTQAWSDIRFIAANGNTIIVVDKSGVMHGAGDNTYGQYDASAEVEEESDDEPEDELAAPTNITCSETTANVVVKWNTVEHADYYEIVVNTNPQTKITSAGNSTSIPASSLVNGTEYMISVKAFANDTNKYGESKEAVVKYVYSAKTIQLNAPNNIIDEVTDQGWKFSWNSVENADYYMFTFGDDEAVRVDGTEYVVNDRSASLSPGDVVMVRVMACSDSGKYTNSPESSAQKTFTQKEYTVTIVLIDRDTGDQVGDTLTRTVTAGEWMLSSLIQDGMPAEYSLNSGDQLINVTGDYRTEVIVVRGE